MIFPGRLIPFKFSHIGDNHQAYWSCLCSCGVEKVVRLNRVRSGDTLSCGCLLKERVSEANTLRRMPLIEKKARTLFSYFKGEARRRGLKFEISKEEAFSLSQKVCFYCGREPQNRMSIYRDNPDNGHTKTLKYNGIDRIDSSIGYCKENVVPACGDCNRAKNKLSMDDFFSLIEKIYLRRFKK